MWPDQWADRYRRLPPGSAEGDDYQTSRTPYVRGPSRAMVDRRWTRTALCMFTQGGKSNAAYNAIGRILDIQPRPILYIGPTKTNVTEVIEPKVDAMLRSAPQLWAKVAKGKKYTATKKMVAGVAFRFAWAGSTTQIKAETAAVVIVDETDEMKGDLGGQGAIGALADARHGSYPDGRSNFLSSPTEGNVETEVDERTGLEHWKPADTDRLNSPIWAFWQEGTRHEYAWPCPHCREYFIPRFKLLKFPKDATLPEIRRKAYVECPHCEAQIANRHRSWMRDRGVYICPGQRPLKHADADRVAHIADYTAGKPVKRRGGRHVYEVEFGDYHAPDACDTESASFWVSGLANFSAAATFGGLAAIFTRAARSKDLDEIKGTINTKFGECWKFGGDAPSWIAVKARALPYRHGEVPPGVVVLFLTIDMQADRLVYVVRGWGVVDGAVHSWLVEEGELWGKTSQPAVWEEADALLEREWGGLRIAKGAVDSGYLPDMAYAFCLRHRGVLVPTKGHQAIDREYYASTPEVNRMGKAVKRPRVQLWHVDVDRTKAWVHGQIDLQEGVEPTWHVHSDVGEYYCEQIVAEARLVTPAGKAHWKQTGRNDYLDCEALQRFLARKWARLIGRLSKRRRAATESATDTAAPSAADEPDRPSREIAQPARRRRRRRGFSATSWR